MAEEKKDYIFTGRSFSAPNKDGERVEYKAGDTVALTDAQFEAFKDQFAEPDTPKVAKAATEEKKAEVKPQAPQAGTAHI